MLLRSMVLLSLASTLLACGETTPVTPGDGDSGPGDCTCTATVGDDTRELACGEATCVGPSGDDRWVTCSATGTLIGDRLCIQDRWDATTSAPFDCDGQQTCPADTYCVVRAGAEPRRTECRPIPTSCTPPASDQEFCDCLEPDAISADVCDGTTGGLAGCNIFDPRRTEVLCSDF